MDDGEEEESIVVLSPIANPLAKDKLVKKILKLVKAGELCVGSRTPNFTLLVSLAFGGPYLLFDVQRPRTR